MEELVAMTTAPPTGELTEAEVAVDARVEAGDIVDDGHEAPREDGDEGQLDAQLRRQVRQDAVQSGVELLGEGLAFLGDWSAHRSAGSSGSTR